MAGIIPDLPRKTRPCGQNHQIHPLPPGKACCRSRACGCIGKAALCYPVDIMAKSPCPVSKTHFIEKAEPIKLVINGQELVADKREFSTGSFGWFFNGKISVAVDGKPVSVQVGLNLTVVGSKDADR
jgi:hypothetical protein